MKRSIKIQIAILSLSGLAFQSCTAQDNITGNDYTACCGSKTVERAIGKGSMYIPNVFTPNGDGVNDFFRPYVSEGLEAQAFTIYSAVGDTILYSRSYFNNADIKTNLGWNGLRKDGTAYKGIFKYGVAVYAENNIREEITGEACCVRCDPAAAILKTKEGCFYPAQAGKNGNLDKTLSINEKECL